MVIRLRYCFRTCLIMISLLCGIFLTTHAALPKLTLQLKPFYDTRGNASGMEVSYKVPFNDTFRHHDLKLVLSNMLTLGRRQDTISQLIVTDEQGAVSFGPPQPDQQNDRQTWQATRPVVGEVLVKYRILAAYPDRKGGPQFDMQAVDGGLIGAFISILLLPAFEYKCNVRLNWSLPANQFAISTFGVGNLTAPTAVSYEELLYAQFLVGQPFSYPTPPPAKGFSIAGLGLRKEQIQDSIYVHRKNYDILKNAFQNSTNNAFRFLFRSFSGALFISGTATKASNSGSFLVNVPPGSHFNSLDNQDLVAHEMIHVFVSDIVEESGDWYVEGIADYLSSYLLYKAGIYTKAFYLDRINTAVAAYYTNALRLKSEQEMVALKWTTMNAWIISYSRGMLYFADLDAKLSQLKNKKVSVLSLVREMNKLAAKDTITSQTWIRLLKKEAGDWAVKDFEKMFKGELIIPAAGSFSSDFNITPIKTGIFDIGFRTSRSIRAGSKIAGLDTTANAYRAGLREGDEVVHPVDLESVYSSYDQTVTLTVKRNDQVLQFTFNPRKEPVDGFRWEIAPGKL